MSRVSDEYGYIYSRINEMCNLYNCCKLGKSNSIPNRESSYATYEVKRGVFVKVFQVSIHEMDKIEKELIQHFTNQGYHIQDNGGKEFFDKKVTDLIELFLEESGYKYKELSKDEIDSLVRKAYPSESSSNKKKYEPFPIQETAIRESMKYFEKNDIGKIIWACGLGKALLCVFIVQYMRFDKVVIGVPSCMLQKQMIQEIRKIFFSVPILCIGTPKKYIYEDIKKDEDANEPFIFTTNTDKISSFIQKNTKFFIITTYTSCNLLLDYTFDFKVGDEAHHLVGNKKEKKEDENNSGYVEFHNIVSNKTLFMTATEKFLEKVDYSMDNKEIFGETIHSINMLWAIENKRITDYNVVVIQNTKEEIQEILKKIKIIYDKRNISFNKELFLATYTSMYSISISEGSLSHILIYTNKTEQSDEINTYIKIIIDSNILPIFTTSNTYHNSLHSNITFSKKNKKDSTEVKGFEGELDEFKKAKYGIISCVYIFGEGFDLPKLNGVTFAVNMESDIRIVQSSLRPNRINKLVPNKKATIIIPHMEGDDDSFTKIIKIIYKLGNEDMHISSKIKLLTIDKSYKKKDPKERKSIENYYLENKEELYKLKITLIDRKALFSLLPEIKRLEKKYQYHKEFLKKFNLKSSKEYIEHKEKYEEMYIPEPISYFTLVWKNWYDFLSIDTSLYHKDIDDWRKFCKDNGVCSVESYYKLYENYPTILPYTPSDYYENCNSILQEFAIQKRRR